MNAHAAATPAKARMRCAIYSRVSTDHQTTENQERELLERAERAGWEVVKIYTDHGVSGSKSGKDRPAFEAMRKDAAKRNFDVIAEWSVDRLGRSLQTLVEFLSNIHGYGVDLYLHTQGVDTTTPAGKALFQMMGVFSEFERAMIQERVKSGLERAKAQGAFNPLEIEGGADQVRRGLEQALGKRYQFLRRQTAVPFVHRLGEGERNVTPPLRV